MRARRSRSVPRQRLQKAFGEAEALLGSAGPLEKREDLRLSHVPPPGGTRREVLDVEGGPGRLEVVRPFRATGRLPKPSASSLRGVPAERITGDLLAKAPPTTAMCSTSAPSDASEPETR